MESLREGTCPNCASLRVLREQAETSCAALLADKRRLADTVTAQVEEMKALSTRLALLEKVAEAAKEYVAMIEHPSTEFKTIDLTCDPVRVVNELIAALDAAKEGK